MNIIKQKHFSLEDWDYATPGPYISDVVYISAPSSLAARYDAPFDRQGWAMCKLAAAQNVFDGRIVNYNRYGISASSFINWFFRTQANPPEPTTPPANCYYTHWGVNYVYLFRRVAGGNTTLATYNFDPALSFETWYHFRTTWWQYLDPSLTKLLRIIVEQFKEGAWVELFTHDNSDNLWADEAINKIGFMLLHDNSDKETAIDNSEIWKRTT